VRAAADPQAMFLELVLDHGFVALQAAHAERFHDLVRAVAGIDQDRPGAPEYQHAEHQHAAGATAIAPEHQEARFKLFNVPVIENLDLQRHTILPRSELPAPDSLLTSMNREQYVAGRRQSIPLFDCADR